jgi:hypothetical protein
MAFGVAEREFKSAFLCGIGLWNRCFAVNFQASGKPVPVPGQHAH